MYIYIYINVCIYIYIYIHTFISRSSDQEVERAINRGFYIDHFSVYFIKAFYSNL